MNEAPIPPQDTDLEATIRRIVREELAAALADREKELVCLVRDELLRLRRAGARA